MPLNHLAVYLTNRCNLSCSYCYVSVNEGPAVRLDEKQLRESVDRFLDTVPAPDRKITFLGGEPLLDFPLLVRAVEYCRSRGGRDVVLQTFTNGTLLTPERLRFLDDNEVYVTVSLDGRKKTNDASRTFFGQKDRSVFEEVMKRLDGLPKEHLGASLVFTSETVGELLANVEFFHRMGFGRITFNPELYELWPEDRIEVLDRVMAGFRRYYRLLLDGAHSRPFVLQILFAVLENLPKNQAGTAWWHDCHNMVLGPDQKFYACDKALTFPIGTVEEQRIGDPVSGLDFEKRGRHYAEAISYIEGKGWGRDEYFCPMGLYFYASHAKMDPAPLMENFHKVSDVFSRHLIALVRENQDHPAFQELYAQPRLV